MNETSSPVRNVVASDRLRPGPLWWLLAVPAVAVAGYALTLQDARAATDLVPGMPWLDEVHFAAGGIALLVGVFAFRRDLLVRHTAIHRRLGMIYCAGILLGGLAGLMMAVFSMIALPASLNVSSIWEAISNPSEKSRAAHQIAMAAITPAAIASTSAQSS